ncbi:RNA 2',3'-cyclic phosphodiesterase [Chloroflexota bacterium]
MEQIRSFIAIELPDELKAALARLEARLKSGERYPVKWVNPNSIHITLKFLGNTGIDRVDGITKAITGAAREISPFHLEVKGLGVFPNLKRVQIVWVGVSGETDRLGQLQQRIESNLAPLGFAPESRPFRPHLTLARLRDRASPEERQSFGQLIADTRFEGVYGFNVDCISLMKSQLTREGAIYSRIRSIKLNQTRIASN